MWHYILLGFLLFLATFGVTGLIVFPASIILFLLGALYVAYSHGQNEAKNLEKKLKEVLATAKFQSGIEQLLKNKDRLNEMNQYTEELHSMANSPVLDQVLEQMLGYITRDYIGSWYKNITNDAIFEKSLKRTSRRSIASLVQCLRQVDWVPLLTHDVVDDFASHLRLYRKAKEKTEKLSQEKEKKGNEELLSNFFDFELEMEKTLCRDLLSTTPHYENAYLHDLVDIILYLIMPPEDFRCRPLRFLLREVVVGKVLLPTLDYLSDPNEIFQLIVWLFSEVEPKPEDFILCLENSTSVEELEAIFQSILDEKTVMRGKDSGGAEDTFVRQQLASLQFVENLIKRKMAVLTNGGMDSKSFGSRLNEDNDQLVQLPIHVVLTNSIGVSYFIDFLKSVGGQNYIDCYLAIEGFKVSVEHQMRTLANGELVDRDAYETIKEAAHFMYQQYLSEEAITRVPLDEKYVAKFLSRLRNDEPSDVWFEQIQEKIVEVLTADDHFYPAFKKSAHYLRMLQELGIIEEERSETPISEDFEVASSVGSMNSSNLEPREERKPSLDDLPPISSPLADEPVMTATVETLGIGQQGKTSFALYNVRVNRTVNGQKISGWNVLRRYSDFHTLHSVLTQKYPKLASLSFPGKKTFNNLDQHFLEKRTRALNQYLDCVLQPGFLRNYPELEKVIYDFLSQKEYTGTKGEPLTKKMMSAIFDPVKLGVKAVGSTVMAVPDQVYGGVSKVGAGIGNAAKIIGGGGNSSGQLRNAETDRVAASLPDTDSENIPFRVLLLFVDEVFGGKSRNAWFRRQMVIVIRQFVTPFGTSINNRIIDVVNWLTSEQQVTGYLNAFRDSMWPSGQLAPEIPPKPASFHHRCRILAKTLMLSTLPDELRMILGSDPTYQGIDLITEAFQNRNLNRRLLYVLLERVLCNVFPQNRFEKIFAQLHSKSPRTKKM
ncbi:unnamed protein product [Caenorhabditis angaria]|uniref:Sorting nexin-13 n=1 Tax=Caenorhabditis angaria TaxID=860376 RepID=A0A9P1N0Z3_9PELO|nr:unnamed protein product [Caenorhabditis angaria]